MGTRKLRHEGFLSPYHPQYLDILSNFTNSMRAQDFVNVTAYQEWVLFGYLVCHDELLRVTSTDIAWVVLKENLVLTLFRDEYILLHEDYPLYVLPRILESTKMAKFGCTKQKEADLEYIVAKRILLKQEIGTMVLFFTNQHNLFAPNIQMVFSALALAQYEVICYFQHVGTALSKPLIDSITGALEGLINILDSKGGFGALENPEQVASYLNYASRVSIASYKSPKGAVGFPSPGHDSFPENNSSIQMLEAAMQRLTNLCSVLNDMEPICVLNHIFVLREYMRECIEEATWEAVHVHHQFPSFCLKDKADFQEGRIDSNHARAPLGHKPTLVYVRRKDKEGQG